MKGSKDKKKNKRIIISLIIVISFIILITICFVGYINDFYKADIKMIEEFTITNTEEIKIISENNTIVVRPKETKNGLIFYPGGKVEHTAYIPLMKDLASKGIMCVLVEMPFNLAVFDVNAADKVLESYPQIENWYIGGHSLGGSMAATYLSENEDVFKGLILLGSYSTAELSDLNIDVLSLYGSEDKVMNRENYEKNKENLPENFSEIIIDGGCHAYFGMYGLQEGDGKPTITNVEQINQATTAIAKLINEKDK